ncbi:791_t:CDS:2 [Cetraspora pellucida]|uniref:791_t:CDS:1 n=1 Tax=Cetraspora pellucida TaxID=1433469 RepID=A0ACA9KBQ0_9GLOM|nr:791_t:CDS:2 [Cetraspora pellucida]
MSKKTLSNLPNEITYIVFNMLCIDRKNAKYFKYTLKAWNQVLKWSMYYNKFDENETKNSPLFNYLEYIEELSFSAIDLYCDIINFYEIFANNKHGMIIRKNVIKFCKKLKYFDIGINYISDKDWKENNLDILFIKIESMTDVVIGGIVNLGFEEIISSYGIRVKSIKYKNILYEKTQNQLNFSSEKLEELGKLGGSGKLTNNYIINYETQEPKQEIVYQFYKESKDYFQQLNEVE